MQFAWDSSGVDAGVPARHLGDIGGIELSTAGLDGTAIMAAAGRPERYWT